MRLTQVRDFVTVVQLGSIRAAARELGLSQPAVSKSVHSLEDELRIQLLRRTSRGIVPTPSGEAFFARARLAHGQLCKAEAEATQFAEQGAISVAFGIGPAAAALLVADGIATFQRQFPQVGVRIVEGLGHLLLPRVRDGTLDFVVGPRFHGNLDPGMSFRPLFRSEYVIVGRKRHPLRNARSVKEIAQAKWLSLLPATSRGRPLDRIFEAAGLPAPEQQIQCESYNIIVSLLAKSDMLSVLSRWLAAEPMARDLLEEFDVGAVSPSLTVGIYALADAPLTRPAAAMANALQAAARKLKRPKRL